MKRQILAPSAATALAAAALIGTGLAGTAHATAATSDSTNPPANSYISYPPAFTTPPTAWPR